MMNRRHTRFSMPRQAAVAALILALLLGTLSAAYAADLGGLKQAVRVWIKGRSTEAELTQNEDYSYTLTWQDEDGETREMGGGGVVMEDDGSERAITAEEYLEQLTAYGSLENDENGRLWLYYYDQAVDITDAFDDADNCHIALEHGGRTAYFLIHGNSDSDWALMQSEEGFERMDRDFAESEALDKTEREISIDIQE